jgi:nicotinate dehydrogenase subunit A
VLRTINLMINGERRSLRIDDTTTLLDALRNHLDLKAARFGCGAGQCGTCAVIVEGEEHPACQLEIGNLEGKAVTTLEGIGTADRPHPLQSAFIELQAGQCGYCLSGIIVGAKALLDRNPNPSRTEIATALAWHLCRCGAHNRILAAVALAAERMRESVPA